MPVGQDVTMAPPSPGEALRRLLLERYNITQDRLATALGVSRYSVHQLLQDNPQS
jgi:plasmid maintenance system antidote protein VapI